MTRPEIKTVTTSVVDRKEKTTRDQTLEFLRFETEHSSQVYSPAFTGQINIDKVKSQFLISLIIFKIVKQCLLLHFSLFFTGFT